MDWQTPIALLIVLLAAAWLARAMWPGGKGGKSCGSGCGSCSQAKPPQAANLVTLAGLKDGKRDP